MFIDITGTSKKYINKKGVTKNKQLQLPNLHKNVSMNNCNKNI